MTEESLMMQPLRARESVECRAWVLACRSRSRRGNRQIMGRRKGHTPSPPKALDFLRIACDLSPFVRLQLPLPLHGWKRKKQGSASRINISLCLRASGCAYKIRKSWPRLRSKVHEEFLFHAWLHYSSKLS